MEVVFNEIKQDTINIDKITNNHYILMQDDEGCLFTIVNKYNNTNQYYIYSVSNNYILSVNSGNMIKNECLLKYYEYVKRKLNVYCFNNGIEYTKKLKELL